MAQNVTIAGASYAAVPAVDIPKTGGGTARFVDTSDADAAAQNIAQGKTAYVNGQKIVGTATGGSTLVEKTVTENGVYLASAEQADGYSKVTVAVEYTSYRTGHGAPASSLGIDGDLYLDLG